MKKICHRPRHQSRATSVYWNHRVSILFTVYDIEHSAEKLRRNALRIVIIMLARNVQLQAARCRELHHAEAGNDDVGARQEDRKSNGDSEVRDRTIERQGVTDSRAEYTVNVAKGREG